MFDNMYKVQIANSGDVAGFPKSHDGLEKAIILASREGTDVTFDGEVVWSSKDWFFVMREMKTYKFKSTDMTPENLQIIEDGHEFYYDPEMGQYYDRDTDFYLTYDEYLEHDNWKKHWFGHRIAPSWGRLLHCVMDTGPRRDTPDSTVLDHHKVGVW